jgi:AcrR family transcriptional regulator
MAKSKVSSARPAKKKGSPRRRTQAERSEDMRLRLSRAAYEVIAKHGHSAFRTAMIAKQAGVSEGALSHHFPTKDAVTLAAIERALQLAKFATNKRLMQKPTTIQATLTLMIEDFRAFFNGDSFWAALDITMDASKSAAITPEIRRIVAEHRIPVYARWTDILISLGWTATRASKVVRMTSALVSGMAIRTLWTDDTRSDAFAASWLQFVMNLEA